MRAAARGVLLAAAAATLAVLGCNDSKPEAGQPPKLRPAARLGACVAEWNADANFTPRNAGAVVRRLERESRDPLFAHVSRDGRQRCVVFVDTITDVDDRRLVRVGGRFKQTCKGLCEDQAPPGSRTLRLREDGSLPRPQS